MISDKNSFIKGVMTGMRLGYPDYKGIKLPKGYRARTGEGGTSIFNRGYACLVRADEAKAKELLQSCGIQKKVLVTVVSETLGYVGGIYFNKQGVLTVCKFKGHYPWGDDRNFGVYDFDKISIVETGTPTNYKHNAIFSHSYRFFYSKEMAEASGHHAASTDNDSLVPAWDLKWTVDGEEFENMTDHGLYYHKGHYSSDWYVSDGWASSTSRESISYDTCSLSSTFSDFVDPESVVFY